MHGSRPALPTAVLTVTIGLAFHAAPIQRPEFSTTTELVRVYATVRDKTGHLVTDLESSDFEIRDRGRPVPLALFSTDAQPITAAVMVDMSGVMFERQTYEYIRQGLTAFVDRFEPPDRARIGWFSHREVDLGPDLTADKDVLEQMVTHQIRVERAHPEFTNDVASYFSLRRAARPLWNAIAASMQSLVREPGRKIVLVLTNGSNTSSLPGLPGIREIKENLPRDEFMIYVVHGFEPRRANGLRRESNEDIIARETAERTLRELTEVTGGGFINAPFDATKRGMGWSGADAQKHPLSRAFVAQLADLVDELRHQYALAFVPTRRDGNVAKIDVRVGRPDIKVWARKTYQSPFEPNQ
jgi:Ca-activated chloride channel family protein